MGIICILLVITVIGILALPDVLSAWSAMRLNEKLFNSELNNIQNKIEIRLYHKENVIVIIIVIHYL